MTCKIRNIASRPVSVHLNSGQTVHLAPGLEIDLLEVEIANNAMFEKLRKNKLLDLVVSEEATTKPIALAKANEPAPRAETVTKGAQQTD